MRATRVIRLFALAAVIGNFESVVAHAETWLCIEDQVAGFKLMDEGKAWNLTSFTTGDRYLVKPLDASDIRFDPTGSAEQYGVFPFGSDVAQYSCPWGFNIGYSLGNEPKTLVPVPVVNCNGAGQFRMNREALRFMTTYFIGYLNGRAGDETDGRDSPYISIGTCSPL